MRTIYKYPLDIVDTQIVRLPRGSLILTCQIQNNELYLWAEIDTNEKETVNAVVSIFGTGHSIPLDYDGYHLASVQQDEYVWHVFLGIYNARF